MYIPNEQAQAYLFLHSRFHIKTHFHSPLPPSAFVFHHPHQQLVEVPGCACSQCSQTFLSPSKLWRPCIIWHDMTWRPSTAVAICREADSDKEEESPGYNYLGQQELKLIRIDLLAQYRRWLDFKLLSLVNQKNLNSTRNKNRSRHNMSLLFCLFCDTKTQDTKSKIIQHIISSTARK